MLALVVRRPTLVGCLLLSLAIGSVTFLSARAAPDPIKKVPSETDKVRKALDETVTIDVTDQPLSQVLNQLRERGKINIIVDKPGILQTTGIDPDQMQVTARLKDVKVRGCLRAILGPHNLGYAIIGDTILVSNDDLVMQRQIKQRVSIDLDKADFADALKQVAHDTGTSIILDPRVVKDVKTKVTLTLDDVPLESAVRLLAESAGLKPVRVGNVLFVTSKANAAAMRNDAATDPLETIPVEIPKDSYKDKAK